MTTTSRRKGSPLRILLQHEDHIDDEKMEDKVSAHDEKPIADKCDEAIKWLDVNQLAEVEEFTDKQKEVEGIWNLMIR